MNDQANTILIELLKKATDGIDAAVSFSQAQLPDVVQQLMHWKMASYSMRLLCCLLIIIPLVFLFRKSRQWIDEGEEIGVVGLIFSSVISLLCLIVFAANVGNIIQLWLAPKIWLIEYAASLVK